MATNVITTTDKVQRDAIYKDFRENGDEFERQAVRFSAVRRVINSVPPVYETTYSVAHPVGPFSGDK